VNILFQIFFGYHGSIANLVYACKILGCLGPAGFGGYRERTKSSKPKTYILYFICTLYIDPISKNRKKDIFYHFLVRNILLDIIYPIFRDVKVLYPIL
jgi:hypothetical protein